MCFERRWHERVLAEGRPWARKRAPGKCHQAPRLGRGGEWAGRSLVLRSCLGWGLGASLLVHGAQQLLHVGGQQVIHLVTLDTGKRGWRLGGAGVGGSDQGRVVPSCCLKGALDREARRQAGPLLLRTEPPPSSEPPRITGGLAIMVPG